MENLVKESMSNKWRTCSCFEEFWECLAKNCIISQRSRARVNFNNSATKKPTYCTGLLIIRYWLKARVRVMLWQAKGAQNKTIPDNAMNQICDYESSRSWQRKWLSFLPFDIFDSYRLKKYVGLYRLLLCICVRQTNQKPTQELKASYSEAFTSGVDVLNWKCKNFAKINKEKHPHQSLKFVFLFHLDFLFKCFLSFQYPKSNSK